MLNSAILMMFLYTNFVSLTEVHEKIAWGNQVHDHGAYPYFCSIQYPDHEAGPSGYRHFCGGTLVQRRIMITTAQCLRNASLVPQLRILLNSQNLPYFDHKDSVFKIKNYELHPDFLKQRPYSMHDIAVVLLHEADTRPVTWLELPFKRLPVDTEVRMLGFGLVENERPSFLLREATTSIKNDRKCLDEKTGFEYAPVYNFCTQNSEGAGGCYQDAGGPAVWEDPNTKRSFLHGVLSSEQSPCDKFHTDVFVDVFAHLEFINDAIVRFTRNELGCPKTRKAEIYDY
ncbi:chymotrypsin-1-like [Tetranychus urticae]|uniref:Peptidase S1 domain-containing protein n=1 Tax=Tetranychus urticae TaxID=32264 RepID=T1JRG2_TETUR|nr:chymotrypsin-1-like [Tetranychus urticae]